MDANDRAYYLRRAVQEQEAARTAACAEARERHEQLGAAYRRRCYGGSPLVRSLIIGDPEKIQRTATRQRVGVL